MRRAVENPGIPWVRAISLTADHQFVCRDVTGRRAPPPPAVPAPGAPQIAANPSPSARAAIQDGSRLIGAYLLCSLMQNPTSRPAERAPLVPPASLPETPKHQNTAGTDDLGRGAFPGRSSENVTAHLESDRYPSKNALISYWRETESIVGAERDNTRSGTGLGPGPGLGLGLGPGFRAGAGVGNTPSSPPRCPGRPGSQPVRGFFQAATRTPPPHRAATALRRRIADLQTALIDPVREGREPSPPDAPSGFVARLAGRRVCGGGARLSGSAAT